MSKVSDRHKVEVEEVHLNLNSMMDLFAVLIPALLMMSAVVEVCSLNVVAPSIGQSDETPPPPADKPPLNLTVLIKEGGYVVSGSGGVLAGPGATPMPGVSPEQPTIGLVKRSVSCSRWRQSWPPPRAKNREQPRCEHAQESKSFYVYDTAALTRKIKEVKDAYPDERRIIIQAEPNVEYESIIDVMDATRDVKDSPTSEAKILFDEVVLSPA